MPKRFKTTSASNYKAFREIIYNFSLLTKSHKQLKTTTFFRYSLLEVSEEFLEVGAQQQQQSLSARLQKPLSRGFSPNGEFLFTTRKSENTRTLHSYHHQNSIHHHQYNPIHTTTTIKREKVGFPQSLGSRPLSPGRHLIGPSNPILSVLETLNSTMVPSSLAENVEEHAQRRRYDVQCADSSITTNAPAYRILKGSDAERLTTTNVRNAARRIQPTHVPNVERASEYDRTSLRVTPVIFQFILDALD